MMDFRLVRSSWAVALLTVLSSVSSFTQTPRTGTPNLKVSHYDLRMQVHPEKGNFDATAQLTFQNGGTRAINEVPLMLYRLLSVTAAEDSSGRSLAFSQHVVAMADEEMWQVNQVRVKLPRPLAPRKDMRLTLHYRGTLAGYAEVMRYVQDRVDEDYSLFRAETMPYPVLGHASQESWRRLYDSPFTYDARVTVPNGYVAACGGTPATERAVEHETEFSCRASNPQSQLNIAVARFKVIEDAGAGLRVYAQPQDAAAGATVLKELKEALNFYTSYFGAHAGEDSIAVIEIPEGWGSYTDKGFIFQAAAAFKDPSRAVELYHEVAHRWNARANPKLQRTRWFDEAFAAYFEALALRDLSGEKAYVDDLERARKSFARAAKRDPKAVNVPISDYGKHDIGQYSYTKGAWSLYVLHQVLGENTFRRTMGQFLKEYQSKPADFQDFRTAVEQAAGHDMKRYFDEWIFGTESSQLLLGGEPVTEMAARYKQ